MLFDLRKGLLQGRAKLPLNPFASAQAIAMFATVGAFELSDQCAGFLCDGAHFEGAITAHVQNRTHMQCAYGCMGIPSTFGAVFLKDLRQCIGVLC